MELGKLFWHLWIIRSDSQNNLAQVVFVMKRNKPYLKKVRANFPMVLNHVIEDKIVNPHPRLKLSNKIKASDRNGQKHITELSLFSIRVDIPGNADWSYVCSDLICFFFLKFVTYALILFYMSLNS